MEMHLTLDLLPLLLQLLLQVLLLLLLQLAFARLEFDLGFCGFSVAGALVRRSNALLAWLIRQRQFLCPPPGAAAAEPTPSLRLPRLLLRLLLPRYVAITWQTIFTFSLKFKFQNQNQQQQQQQRKKG